MTLSEARNIVAQLVTFGAKPNWKMREEAQRVKAAYYRLLELDEESAERDEILRKFPALRREI